MSDFITEDTLALILKWLPVKALLRFRSVCKEWKELINSPTFLNEHLDVQKPRLIVEYGESEEFLVVDPCTLSTDTLSYPMGFQRGGLESRSIIGTLNGVVCLSDWETDVHIWNPKIRKSFTLALPDGFRCDIVVDEPWNCYGFWIDPSTKEFKIIVMLFPTEPDLYLREGYLYSSKRHDWSVIPRRELGEWTSDREGTAVMIGGVGHWVGGIVDKLNVILSFDFKQERFEFIETNGVEYSLDCLPCHWQGNLSVLCLDHRRCDLYSRQEGNSWAHMFGFDLHAAPTRMVEVFWPLEGRGRDAVEGHGSTVAALVREDRGSESEYKLVSYDAKLGLIPLKSGINDYDLVNMAHDFVESLLFP